jgi:riboflavin synthase
MFTGLIDSIGTVERVTTTDAGRELRIACDYTDITEGESVAVNGACLTVREHGRAWFTVAAAIPTLERTAIGRWGEGTRVNLERALRADARFGGHIVQGHVDSVARVTAARMNGDAWLVDVELPDDLRELMVPLGSIAINGVSLAINTLPAAGSLQVAVIEYTRRHTTLGDLAGGDLVHIEADVIAKYVRGLITPYRPSD